MIFLGILLTFICCIYTAFVFNWVKLNKVIGEIFGDSDNLADTNMQNALTPKILTMLQGPLSLWPVLSLFIPCMFWYSIIGWWSVLIFLIEYLVIVGIISGVFSAMASIKGFVTISLNYHYNKLADYKRDNDEMRVEASQYIINLLEMFISFVDENLKEGYKITLFRLEKAKLELKNDFEEAIQY